jgi:seryl-tRNA synthetase
MHDIRWIRENPKAFDEALNRRPLNDEERKRFSSEQLISIDERRRAIIRVLEGVKARRNALSKEVGQAKAKKDEVAVQRLIAEAEEAKISIPQMERELKEAEEELYLELSEIPNLPLKDVPAGTSAADNVERGRYYPERVIKFEDFEPKQHFDLGETLGQMDFETAAKLSGARFVVLKEGLARLERALGQFMLDFHTTKHGYVEVNPPLLVRSHTMYGTAQLPKFLDDQFSVQAGLAGKHFVEFLKAGGQVGDIEGVASPFWLIPTAEVPLTNLVRESILDEAQLPMRFTACTPCFRAEAGAAGKDTRGMIRQHQFTKVELVSITTPEQSEGEHERMLACAEEVLKKLELQYRVMTLCTGDMGFASQKTYDIEVWLPGQNMYREISSCSICGAFQARRMHPSGSPSEGTRYRGKDGRIKDYVHTLNGSGVAVGRALIAVMETYQQADGSIAVPDALAPYMGGIKTIGK